MILTVDAGNTNIKVCAWDNNKIAFITRFQTNTMATSDEYALKLFNMFSLVDFNTSQFDGAIISSVVPQLSKSLITAIKQVIEVENVLEVLPGLKTGLNIKIDNPATLGSDMVCAGVSVINNYKLPAIMMSLGTANAIFAINEKAELLGGSIVPGVMISLNALSSGTAQLPYISLDNPKDAIGKNTIDSMTAGIVYGNAGMIDRIIKIMKSELKTEDASLIATGGLADLIVPYCEENIIINDNLIFEGLKIIYDKNNK